MVSKDYIICPHCKKQHTQNVVIGTSGLINYCGREFSFTCDRCGNEVYGEMEVTIKYKTRKTY